MHRLPQGQPERLCIVRVGQSCSSGRAFQRGTARCTITTTPGILAFRRAIPALVISEKSRRSVLRQARPSKCLSPASVTFWHECISKSSRAFRFARWASPSFVINDCELSRTLICRYFKDVTRDKSSKTLHVTNPPGRHP
jgi:hypothetical protein